MRQPGLIELEDGREIQIQILRQELTYAGLLEGLPTRQRNKRIIDNALSKAQSLRTTHEKAGSPYLVTPVETKIEFAMKYPFGDPASLPSILCMAGCLSGGIRDRTDPLVASWLTIVWFQDQYAFPIDPSVLARVRTLAWGKWATEYEM